MRAALRAHPSLCAASCCSAQGVGRSRSGIATRVCAQRRITPLGERGDRDPASQLAGDYVAALVRSGFGPSAWRRPSVEGPVRAQTRSGEHARTLLAETAQGESKPARADAERRARTDVTRRAMLGAASHFGTMMSHGKLKSIFVFSGLFQLVQAEPTSSSWVGLFMRQPSVMESGTTWS